MSGNEPSDPLIEEATNWLLRLEEAPTDSTLRSAAESWRLADPAHARAWKRAERAWRLIARTDPTGIEPAASQRPAKRTPARARSPIRRWTAGVLAALAACLLAIYVPSVLTDLGSDFSTSTAELRQVVLDDGTVVQLSPRTALEVRFTSERREVTLLSGEAFFDVAAQRDRPFGVTAGELSVVVVGTAFDVRLSDESVTVSVQRGAVDVQTRQAASSSPVGLGAGDLLIFGRRSGEFRRTRIPPEEVASWRDHRLFVEGATVQEVVEELRRYRSGWIVVADTRLAAQQVTGLYDLRDPDHALRALVGPFGGRVREVTPLLRVVSGP